MRSLAMWCRFPDDSSGHHAVTLLSIGGPACRCGLLLQRPCGWHAGGVPSSLPDFMPVVAGRMRRGDYRGVYEERELTAPIDLCDPQGRLSPAAVGWSRVPLVRANL